MARRRNKVGHHWSRGRVVRVHVFYHMAYYTGIALAYLKIIFRLQIMFVFSLLIICQTFTIVDACRRRSAILTLYRINSTAALKFYSTCIVYCIHIEEFKDRLWTRMQIPIRRRRVITDTIVLLIITLFNRLENIRLILRGRE